jgi:hypothetical protein
MTDDVYNRLPVSIKKLATQKSKLHYYKINMNDWAISETNAPIYAEKRVLKQYKKYFDQFTDKQSEVFIIWNMNNRDKRIY